MPTDYKVAPHLWFLGNGTQCAKDDQLTNTPLETRPLLLGVVNLQDPQPAHLALDKDDLTALTDALTAYGRDPKTGMATSAPIIGRPALALLCRWAVKATEKAAGENEMAKLAWALNAPLATK